MWISSAPRQLIMVNPAVRNPRPRSEPTAIFYVRRRGTLLTV